LFPTATADNERFGWQKILALPVRLRNRVSAAPGYFLCFTRKQRLSSRLEAELRSHRVGANYRQLHERRRDPAAQTLFWAARIGAYLVLGPGVTEPSPESRLLLGTRGPSCCVRKGIGGLCARTTQQSPYIERDKMMALNRADSAKIEQQQSGRTAKAAKRAR
jgi:hypothetical protein